MDGIIAVVLLFLTAVVLLLGILFLYFAFKLIGQEIPIGFNSTDKMNRMTTNEFTREENVPIDQFIPRKDMPIKIKYSEENKYTK